MVRNIGGRFDQPTNDFYETRYQRLKPLLASTDIKQAMPLYDDAAVALLRVGNFTDAIILLDRKTVQAKLLTTAEAARAERTTLANKAACLVARYTSADGQDQRDLQQALQLLDRLLQKDPYDTDAEFARREVKWHLGARRCEEVAAVLIARRRCCGLGRDAGGDGERDHGENRQAAGHRRSSLRCGPSHAIEQHEQSECHEIRDGYHVEPCVERAGRVAQDAEHLRPEVAEEPGA
jgi:tetratricopeptide (TPR) repeat protein